MRNVILAVWLIFAAFIFVPVISNVAGGQPEEQVTAIIEKEAEAKNIEITAEEKQGNKAMYAFKAGDDFGVAIFSHFADSYKYIEGTMSNGQKKIDVNLNSGWDMYRYKVGPAGAEQVEFDRLGGSYMTYALLFIGMVIVSLIAMVYGARIKKKHEEQRKKGLRM